MNFSIFTISSLAVFGLYSGCHPGVRSTDNDDINREKPNIIFLLADDLRWDALGCMGNSHVLTPNIDKLATESVTFVNTYHVAPICLPSRSSIMTGKYLGTHGSGFDRPTNYGITEEEFEASYPVLLGNAGYFTGFVGKFGFAVTSIPEKVPNNKPDREKNWHKEEYMPKDCFDLWYGFPGQGEYRPLPDGSFNGYENIWNADHLNEFMGCQAAEFMQIAAGQVRPFCLSVSFKAPHAPFDPQEQFRKLYGDKYIPRMQNDDPNYFERLPQVVREKSRNAKWYSGKTHNPAFHLADDSTYQAFIKNYYALITGLDDVVGKIRDQLNELRIADNTVIILTSDNGFFCGSRQLAGKALLYDESARAPLIVYYPGYAKNKGIKKQSLISIVDIAPSILDLAGIDKPAFMPGESFIPVVRGDTDEIHEAVFGENNFDNFHPVISEVKDPDNYQSVRSKFVRTKDYKFIRYHECHPVIEELFKVSDDPSEFVNLINNAEYKDVAEKMRNKLEAFEKNYVSY